SAYSYLSEPWGRKRLGGPFQKTLLAAHPCGASAPPSVAPQIFGKALPSASSILVRVGRIKMTQKNLRISFLGIGLMGAPMTRNLLDAGFSMTLWNRTASKCEPFASEATIAGTPSEAVADADIVITMLENGLVVDDVLVKQGAMAAVKPGGLVIDMSSVEPSLARQHAELAAEQGAGYVDAPVSGGTVGAAEARLSIMAGGSEADSGRAWPGFNALGKCTRIGPVGAGQLAKLANQAIVGITIGAVSEALLLAAKGGADPAAVREALMGGFAGSRILELHGQRMIDRDFAPGAPA